MNNLQGQNTLYMNAYAYFVQPLLIRALDTHSQ